MQTMDIVGVVDAERRLNDRQLHDELDARRTAQAKIRSRCNAELPAQVYILLNSRKLSRQVGEARLVKLQSALAKDAVGAAVKKQHSLHRAAHDGDAILYISKALRVASRKSDAIDFAAERATRESERIVVALAPRGIYWIVDGVIADRGGDGARNNSVQRARTGDAAELHLGKQQFGRIVKGGDVGPCEAVIQRGAGEREFSNRVARKDCEAGAVLVVVLNELGIDADGLSAEERRLPGLVKLVAAGKNRESRGDRPVKQIGLGESEKEAAREIAELRRESQSFAKTQKVVGLIREADEAAGQAADTALQPDRLFALFLQLEVDVNRAIFIVAFDLRSLVRFDLVEVVELIEAEDAHLPQSLVEELAFINRQFAANYFVAGGGVPAEVDAPDEILLLFVELQRQVDDFLIFVDFRVRLGSEIDESVFAVNFAVGFQGLANFFSGENVALFK